MPLRDPLLVLSSDSEGEHGEHGHNLTAGLPPATRVVAFAGVPLASASTPTEWFVQVGPEHLREVLELAESGQRVAWPRGLTAADARAWLDGA